MSEVPPSEGVGQSGTQRLAHPRFTPPIEAEYQRGSNVHGAQGFTPNAIVHLINKDKRILVDLDVEFGS